MSRRGCKDQGGGSESRVGDGDGEKDVRLKKKKLELVGKTVEVKDEVVSIEEEVMKVITAG